MRSRGERIRDAWAGWLGCPPEALERAGHSVVASERVPRDRVLILRRGATSVVRCHPEHEPRVAHALAAESADASVDVAALERLLGDQAGERVPPEEVLYLDPDDFMPMPDDPLIREIGASDAELFETLCAACTPREVVLSEVEMAHPCVVGRVESGALCAVSSYIELDRAIADVGILTHPAARGRGHATAVASLVCEVAFARGLVPQWFALRDNAASLGVARKLGFRHWAFDEGLRWAVA